MKTTLWSSTLVLTTCGFNANAQSLFNAPLPPQQTTAQPQPAPAPEHEGDKANTTPSNQPQPQPANQQTPEQPAHTPPATQGPNVRNLGMFVVKPIRPRDFQKHDKVEIIVNETSIQKFEQTADQKKSYDLKAELSQFPSLEALIRHMTLADGIGTNTPDAGAKGGSNFKGQGTYERKDRMTAHISGLVTDVKPNGMILVEARETIQSDKETKTMIVSGLVDPKDVTTTGSVQSSQMANLVIKVEHTGDVKDSNSKGWLPKLIDSIVGN